MDGVKLQAKPDSPAQSVTNNEDEGEMARLFHERPPRAPHPPSLAERGDGADKTHSSRILQDCGSN